MYEGDADSYHIAISAEGYVDGELFMEPIAAEQNVDGIVIKLTKVKGANANAERVNVTGIVTKEGKPVGGMRVGASRKRRDADRVNVTVQRGRTVSSPGFEFTSTTTKDDGSYRFELLQPSTWYFQVEGIDNHTTVVGPTKLTKGEGNVSVPIALVEPGSIEGKVENIPQGLSGNVWVVAFSEGILWREVRVKPDRTFRLDGLPPGKYGLKVGHDDYIDPHVPRETKPGDFQRKAEPWQGAVEVQVNSGGNVRDLVLDFRPPGPLIEKETKP